MNKENVIKHLESDYEEYFLEVITNDHSYLSQGLSN